MRGGERRAEERSVKGTKRSREVRDGKKSRGVNMKMRRGVE